MKYLITILIIFFSITELYSQFNLPGVLQRKVEEKTEEAVEKALEEDEKKPDEENENKEEAVKDESKAPVALTFASYSKYDFIPGESIFFFEDFEKDAIGDFPVLWNTNGSGEVTNTNLFPGKWLKMNGSSTFIPTIKYPFPENFTIEFDLVLVNSNSVLLAIYGAANPKDFNEGGAIPGYGGIKIDLGDNQHYYSNYADGQYIMNGSSQKSPLIQQKKFRLSVWIQKQRLRLYVNQTKVFDIPQGIPVNNILNTMRFETAYGEQIEVYVSNFRLASGLPDLRNKLLTEGKIVSYGIYFDSGSDKIKPESYPSLKTISDVLTANPEVKINVVGHTDSDGKAEKNLDLSKKRAESIKNSLINDFKIDAGRIQTDGKGSSEPVSDNNTTEGKSKNRRVEFIKI
jgi:outer membrane protein OmpA-like peptidoglycan-associated protein